MSDVSSTLSVPPRSAVPRHIAIIMDGNGRWAKKRFLPRTAGHLKGLDRVRNMVKACSKRGVEYLTVFAFSSENWRRPPEEVSFLMKLFRTSLEREIAKLHANGIRLKVVGNRSQFDEPLQAMIAHAEKKTAENKLLTLTICANYGGRWDVMQAVNEMLATNPKMGGFSEENLTPHLSMAYAPEPDLFIRTGGEMRISNFLLWQLAYTEMYFTDMYWPDFDETALDAAIASYRQRERRFGRTSEQLTKE